MKRRRHFWPPSRPSLAGCVITDVRMPEMTGIELLRRLRESGNDIPVIVITGHGDIPLAVEAMKYGAADFFEKPYDDDALLTAVRSALNRQEGAAQKAAERAALNERLATLSNRERQVLEGLGGGKAQQDHRVRLRHQPPHGRNLSRQRDDQDAGRKPFRTRANGDDRRDSRRRAAKPSAPDRRRSRPLASVRQMLELGQSRLRSGGASLSVWSSPAPAKRARDNGSSTAIWLISQSDHCRRRRRRGGSKFAQILA